MTEQLYTTQQAAILLNIRPNLIAYWKHVGRVEVADTVPSLNRGGTEPLYRLTELRPLADAYHERQATRRQKPR